MGSRRRARRRRKPSEVDLTPSSWTPAGQIYHAGRFADGLNRMKRASPEERRILREGRREQFGALAALVGVIVLLFFVLPAAWSLISSWATGG
jgi:hypothetical protein